MSCLHSHVFIPLDLGQTRHATADSLNLPPPQIQTDTHIQTDTLTDEQDIEARDHRAVTFSDDDPETIRVSNSPLKGLTKPHLTMRLFRKSRHERFNDLMVPNGWFVVSCILTAVGVGILPFTFTLNMSPHVVYSVYLLLCAGVVLMVMTAPSACANMGCCFEVRAYFRKCALSHCPKLCTCCFS